MIVATKKQKQELMDALKFLPRTITIGLTGYGGEIAMGRIPYETYDYWKNTKYSLSDLVHDWDFDLDIPTEFRFITDGAWYDCNNLCHESGCEMSYLSHITVEDELEQKVIFESSLELDNLVKHGICVEESDKFNPLDQPNGTCVFVGQSIERGTFFQGEIRITKPFNPKLLVISYYDCNGWKLTGPCITYDGVEIDGNDAYSTSNRSSDYEIICVGGEEQEAV